MQKFLAWNSGEQAYHDRRHEACVEYFSRTVAMVVGNTATGSVWVDITGDGGVFFLGERFRTQKFDDDIVQVFQDDFDRVWMIDLVFLCNADVAGPGEQIGR